MKKKLTLVVALVLVLAISIGGTLAYLTDTTGTVTNTFTVGNVKITLSETDTEKDSDNNALTNKYQMIPGNTIPKDPKVTVATDSEDCWLFVKVEGSANYADFLTHTMAAGWTQLKDKEGKDVDNVFYYNTDITKGTPISVLADDQVTVKTSVTQEMMDNLADSTLPTLTITAYAAQKANLTTAADAWVAVNNPSGSTT